MKTRFILIQTSHAGNVGAAARALKTMGFDDLVLVAPRWPNVLRREETIQRASGALDVLHNARIVATLDEALDGMSHLCATAMTPRDFGPPTSAPRAHFESLLKRERLALTAQGLEAKSTENSALGDGAATSAETGVAFLFGCERFGMANEDVYRCHVALQIPTNPGFGSLNLAAAIQVIAYEWRQALGGFAPSEATAGASAPAAPAVVRADAAQVAGMLAHWEQALVQIGFLDPAAPKKLMPRLNQLFNRAQLQTEEIHILRGVAKAMIEAAQAKH
jgi:tRNA/rRNA methyltransferase